MGDSNNKQPSIILSLPNGKKTVDVATTEGANALLQANSKFFSSTIKKLETLRKKKRLNARQLIQFDKLLKSMIYLPFQADLEIFRAKVPKSEIEHWLRFAIKEIKNVAKTQGWTDEGDLDRTGHRVINSCSSVLKHVVTVNLALEGNFFQVFADLIKARKGRSLPNEDISFHIGNMVYSTALTVEDYDTEWSLEGMYDKFEESGMLEQILRCSTVPLSPMTLEAIPNPNFWTTVLQHLFQCQIILEKKFKPNKPCGQTLKAILEGRDGHPDPPPAILEMLENIAAIVNLVYSKAFRASKKYGICGHCLKSGDSEERLFKCSNGDCGTCYCSRECQLADWKNHKCDCKKLEKMTPADKDKVLSKEVSIAIFMRQNSADVFKRIEEKCESTGLKASDMVVEVDFMPNGSGPAPAWCDPPNFKVVPIRDYVSGAVVPDFVHRVQMDFKSSMAEKESKSLKSGILDSLLLVCHGGNVAIDNTTICKCRCLFQSS